MFDLDIALTLSPGNKAQAAQDGLLFVVQEAEGQRDEETGNMMWTHRLVAVSDETHEEIHDQWHKYYWDFLQDLKTFYLDRTAHIWHPIGYTPIPE